MNAHFAISIFGLGYVGLPISIRLSEFSNKNTIYGVDPDGKKLDNLNKGKSYIDDISDEQIKMAIGKNFIPTNDPFIAIKNSNISLICVPTPVHSSGVPNLQYIETALSDIAEAIIKRNSDKSQLIILESTTYPTTTQNFMNEVLRSYNLKENKDYNLAFSPERIDPGNKKFSFEKIPKIIGADEYSVQTEVENFYAYALGIKTIAATNTRTAEMAKLFENIFRQVNIALVNELALLCEKMDIDMFEVVKLASTKPFGFLAHYPGPGLGGHCIPVDPYYLSFIAKEYGTETRFINLSNEVNEFMTTHVIDLVSLALNQINKSIKNSVITVLGYTYKPNINDIRNSPAIPICKILIERRAVVKIVDDYVDKNIEFDDEINFFQLNDVIGNSDLILILTDHDGIEYNLLYEYVDENCPIVDTRGTIEKMNLREIDFSLGRKNSSYEKYEK